MSTDVMDNFDEPVADTPEDVAILYSWANLHGAKYRDFSASRREYRAQVRHRAAEDMRQSELQAKAAAEAAAADAERVAREAERAARTTEAFDGSAERERILREAESAARRAAAERVEAARRAEAAALADAAARREEREIAEAHASAQRQAARWADSEMRRRTLAGPQPSRIRVPGLASDPYEFAQGSTGGEVDLYTPNQQLNYTQPQRYSDEFGSTSRMAAERVAYGERMTRSGERRAHSGERRSFRPDAEVRRRPQGYRPDEASGLMPQYRPQEPARPRVPAAPDYNRPPQPRPDARPDPYAQEAQRRQEARDRAAAEQQRLSSGTADSGPAWLYSSNVSAPAPVRETRDAEGTLEQARERVAARSWYALKGAFEPGQQAESEPQASAPRATKIPVLAVFSLAGGVGKTSLVATLGRTLSSLGEKVLLADTTTHGLLPYYFGASELRPGVVRTFSPPSGSTDAPIYLMSVDGDQRDRNTTAALPAEITRSAGSANRIVLDLNATAGWMLKRLAEMSPTVLVPVSPDMNSVISLQGVEKFFEGAVDQDGRPIQPHYVINQFDASLPLHLDVREVLRRQLGERLLSFVIRRAPAVSEALAEGMTVVDYAPDAGVAEDYRNIANWVRSNAAPVTQGSRNIRWSER